MHELILATTNPGKIKEFERMLSPIRCIPQSQYDIEAAEEHGLSFIENALIKARHVSQHTGKPALADDSGLVVLSLNGEPGIYSARFAGNNASNAENIALLLHKMSQIKPPHRTAYFYCALALVHHAQDPTPLIATGLLYGEIATAPSGSEGFGYDPIFYLPEHQCTVAELPATIKDKISHRRKALDQLRTLIKPE